MSKLSDYTDKPGFDVYQDSDLNWRWRILSDNGNIISQSSEGYVNYADCEHAAEITLRALIEAALRAFDLAQEHLTALVKATIEQIGTTLTELQHLGAIDDKMQLTELGKSIVEAQTKQELDAIINKARAAQAPEDQPDGPDRA